MSYVNSMTRFSLSEAQNNKCCHCSCEMTLEDDGSPTMATREHIIPRVYGGQRNGGILSLLVTNAILFAATLMRMDFSLCDSR